MLPEQYRLRHSKDVKTVRIKGRSWRHPLLILLVYSREPEVTRFAFIASRRVGIAVERNRAKRRLREAVRFCLPEIADGYDCILIARFKTPQAPYVEIQTAVADLFHKAGLYQ